MSREDDFQTLLEADGTLMAILTGGVYTKAETGRDGITRDATPDAFSSGFLVPCALVKQRGLVPDNAIRDSEEQETSAAQVVEIYIYEDSGYTNIDAAVARIKTLLVGHLFSDSFEVEWFNMIDRERDTGALQGASMARMDFSVRSIE